MLLNAPIIVLAGPTTASMSESVIQTQPANAGYMATLIRVLQLLQRRRGALPFSTSTRPTALVVLMQHSTGANLLAQKALTTTLFINREFLVKLAGH